MKTGSIIRGIGEIEHAIPEQILGHPDFPIARRVFVSEHAKVYEAGVFPAQFGADAGRVTTLAIIVCQHAGYDPADRANWPTLSRLKDTVARFGFASPRLIDSFVARLVQTGYVELRQQPDDNRVRLLCPTERLLAWDRDWMAAHYAALEVLYPDPGFGPARRRDPAFQAAHARSAVAAFDAIIAMMWSNLEIIFFLSSTSALIILLSLFEMGGSDPASRIREADLVQLAPRFAVSRSHLRNILAVAQERNFLVRSGPRNAYIHLTPHWVAAFDRFIAGSLAQSDLTYRLALRHQAEQARSAV
ncbi:hypothetical protein MPPM_0557 [Methylorubrum populi]|uniref:Uncharacterized protein n=1 Tax=Methylorubrum populi TaxID=223967 RepID=A0A161JLJ2_9HYPH|nr:hypothetical protein [Methylorubrum populi]BAU89162.1 hypothetical protein MPPM_0557 [Methylorubrum populi]